MGVVLQGQNETHYQNPDGSFTAIVSDGLNYLSNGEWRDSDTYYLVTVGEGAWSNESDQYHMTLVGGVVSTPDGWWQVEGIYAGDTKLWTPDFTNYGKIGDFVTYLTPWGTLKYTIRPDSYSEVFTFDRNPLAGTFYDGDLTIKYLGGVDSSVWATDARSRDLPVAGSITEKTIPRDDLYRATYPLKVDPTDSFGASGDAYVMSMNGSLFPYPTAIYLQFGNYFSDDGKGNVIYYNYRSLIRFNLSSIAGATVSAATFGVNNAIWGTPTTNTPVVGSTATTDPTAMNATTLWNAVAGTLLGTISLPLGVNNWATLTGTALRNFVGGKVGGFCSIGINNAGTGAAYVASSRYTASTSLRPYLSVTYTISSGYSLTYDANGGTNPPAQQTGSTSYTVAAQGSMTRSGYSFVNWNTLANGTGTSYAAGSTINLSADTTLYAIWQADAPSTRPYYYRHLYGG